VAIDQTIVKTFVKRQIAKARAESGYEWQDIANVLNNMGVDYTAKNLATKFSRGAFRGQELVLLLKIMDVQQLDLSLIELDGLDDAIAAAKQTKIQRLS